MGGPTNDYQKPPRAIHKVARIKLNDPDSVFSVNPVRGSIVNNKMRPGAMSTDKIRPQRTNILGPKSSEPVIDAK